MFWYSFISVCAKTKAKKQSKKTERSKKVNCQAKGHCRTVNPSRSQRFSRICHSPLSKVTSDSPALHPEGSKYSTTVNGAPFATTAVLTLLTIWQESCAGSLVTLAALRTAALNLDRDLERFGWTMSVALEMRIASFIVLIADGAWKIVVTVRMWASVVLDICHNPGTYKVLYWTVIQYHIDLLLWVTLQNVLLLVIVAVLINLCLCCKLSVIVNYCAWYRYRYRVSRLINFSFSDWRISALSKNVFSSKQGLIHGISRS